LQKDKPGAALRFVERIKEKCEQLRNRPQAGEDCSEIRPGMRRIRFQKYLIFYRAGEVDIEVVRVVHGARDWLGLLQGE
jgi:toxin ParE1/3/4